MIKYEFRHRGKNISLYLEYKNIYFLEKDYDFFIKKINKIYQLNKLDFLSNEHFNCKDIVNDIINKLSKLSQSGKNISGKVLMSIFISLIKVTNVPYYIEKNKNKLVLYIEKKNLANID